MSRTFHHGERRIRARGVRQDPPDLRRIARALIALAAAQAEADAQALTSRTLTKAAPKKAPKYRAEDATADGWKESA